MHYPLVAVHPREKGDEPGVFGRQKSVASEVVNKVCDEDDLFDLVE